MQGQVLRRMGKGFVQGERQRGVTCEAEHLPSLGTLSSEQQSRWRGGDRSVPPRPPPGQLPSDCGRGGAQQR